METPKQLAERWWSAGYRYDSDNLLKTTWGLGINQAKISVAGCSVWGNHCFATHTIKNFGNSQQKNKFNPDRDLNQTTALSFVLTEHTGGSILNKIKTTVHVDQDEKYMVLNTQPDSPKEYIGNGTTECAVVLARMIMYDKRDIGLVWLIVDNRLPGVSISLLENCHAVHGLDVCRIEYKNVRLTCEDSLLIGSVGIQKLDFFSTFLFERIAVSSMAVGVVNKWIDRIQERHRERFPEAVEIRHTFRNRYERWRGIVNSIRIKIESNIKGTSLCHATLYKVCLTWIAKECMGELRELGGAAAMFEDFGIKKDEANVDLMCTFAGDNSMLCLFILRTYKYNNIHGWLNRIRCLRMLKSASNSERDVMVLAKAYTWLCLYDIVNPKELYIQDYFRAKISSVNSFE